MIDDDEEVQTIPPFRNYTTHHYIDLAREVLQARAAKLTKYWTPPRTPTDAYFQADIQFDIAREAYLLCITVLFNPEVEAFASISYLKPADIWAAQDTQKPLSVIEVEWRKALHSIMEQIIETGNNLKDGKLIPQDRS